MLKKVKAVWVPPLCMLLVFLLIFISGSVSVNAETASPDENSDTENNKTQSLFRNYLGTPEPESEYPLFREHAERYYPALDLKKASRLSTFMPGLGQAYARNYTKATLFLTAELGTFALAGYNIARALHYNDQGVFETGFQDIRTGEFLTYEQGRTRRNNHAFLSGVFLAAGIGIHIWNIIDAPKTTEAYNNRRFSVQVQQRDNGIRSLIFTHRF
ncbi:hypothetical protein J4G07_11490 [Candidatus Poribacteria bacterium]|nr:hypothetical protein [Candidatus Poribacteria bacterium]